jgi:hypothetical protein
VLATCTGYHALGDHGDWAIVNADNGTTMHVRLSMVPLHVSLIISVKELVPYSSKAVEAWQTLKLDGESTDHTGTSKASEELNRSIVLMQDHDSGVTRKMLALPVAGDAALEVQTASGAPVATIIYICCHSFVTFWRTHARVAIPCSALVPCAPVIRQLTLSATDSDHLAHRSSPWLSVHR